MHEMSLRIELPVVATVRVYGRRPVFVDAGWCYVQGGGAVGT